jgi:1-acyl-sn-glycerol-3-phosphate acyltransferase
VILEVVLLAAFALAAIVCGLAWPLTTRRRAFRVAGFACVYLAVELFGLSACAWYSFRRVWHRGRPPWWLEAHAQVLHQALAAVTAAGRTLLGFRVELTEPPDRWTLEGDDPVLVLARHGGPGDSFALVELLLGCYRRRPRIVAKDLLCFDPALDLLLHRLGGVFLRAGNEVGTAKALSRAAADLASRDALLLFPEGGNWTPRRRDRARARLRARLANRMAAVAEQLDYVLPPRPTGVLACLAGRPDLEIVLVAHAGLDALVSVAQVWAHLPFQYPMSVRWWKAGSRPPVGDRQAAEEWLVAEWAVIDEWIGIQADRQRRLDPGGEKAPAR